MLRTPSFWKATPGRIPKKIFITFDLEWYDQTDGDHLKEIGLAIFADDFDSSNVIHRHLIVSENQYMHNRYCPTSIMGFIFGESETMPLQAALGVLTYWLDGAGTNAEVFLVGHGTNSDYRVMTKHGLKFQHLTRYDTATMFQKLKCDRQKTSLVKMCDNLQVDLIRAALHNAGNDAAYCMQAFALMRKNM